MLRNSEKLDDWLAKLIILELCIFYVLPSGFTIGGRLHSQYARSLGSSRQMHL